MNGQENVHASEFERSHLLRVYSLEKLSEFCTFRYLIVVPFNDDSEHQDCALKVDKVKAFTVLKVMLSPEHGFEFWVIALPEVNLEQGDIEAKLKHGRGESLAKDAHVLNELNNMLLEAELS